jgi:hypothetical protein
VPLRVQRLGRWVFGEAGPAFGLRVLREADPALGHAALGAELQVADGLHAGPVGRLDGAPHRVDPAMAHPAGVEAHDGGIEVGCVEHENVHALEAPEARGERGGGGADGLDDRGQPVIGHVQRDRPGVVGHPAPARDGDQLDEVARELRVRVGQAERLRSGPGGGRHDGIGGSREQEAEAAVALDHLAHVVHEMADVMQHDHLSGAT